MAYAQDTIISANAANDFANVLTGLLVDAGWTLVEALTPAGTFSPNTKVYKSAGLDNQCGYDWYIALMWKGTGTEAQVRIIAGGAYDQPTHLISQIPADLSPVDASSGGSPGRYAAAVTGDMWGTYNVNQATNTATQVTSSRSGTSAQSWPFFSLIVPSSAFGYWASVTLDHFGVFTTIPGSYFASTLDVDPDWAALTAAGFGNGVCTNPVVAFTQNSTPITSQYQGISAIVKGPTGTPSTTLRLAPVANRARPYGVQLPAIDGPYLDAYAWRDAWYLVSLSYSNQSVGGTPTWVNTAAGTTHIGDAIDYYMVYGGSIGDTVEIDGATYVLSGQITGSPSPDQVASSNFGAYVAVLVEP